MLWTKCVGRFVDVAFERCDARTRRQRVDDACVQAENEMRKKLSWRETLCRNTSRDRKWRRRVPWELRVEWLKWLRWCRSINCCVRHAPADTRWLTRYAVCCLHHFRIYYNNHFLHKAELRIAVSSSVVFLQLFNTREMVCSIRDATNLYLWFWFYFWFVLYMISLLFLGSY